MKNSTIITGCTVCVFTAEYHVWTVLSVFIISLPSELNTNAGQKCDSSVTEGFYNGDYFRFGF